MVTWEVMEQEIAVGPACGCSASCCRKFPHVPTGILSDVDHQLIAYHLENRGCDWMDGMPVITGTSEPLPPPDSESTQPSVLVLTSTSKIRCSKPEREIFRNALLEWRDSYWASVRAKYPFLSREWIMTAENIARLVDKAHIFLNSADINASVVGGVIKWMPDEDLTASLLRLLQNFRDVTLERSALELVERQPKRAAHAAVTVNLNQPESDDPFTMGFQQEQWQITDYSHHWYVPALLI